MAHAGAAGDAMASVNPCDVIVLDWILPDTSGIMLSRGLRARGISTPIQTSRQALWHPSPCDWPQPPPSNGHACGPWGAVTRRAGVPADRPPRKVDLRTALPEHRPASLTRVD
jgi:hypothetical protein